MTTAFEPNPFRLIQDRTRVQWINWFWLTEDFRWLVYVEPVVELRCYDIVTQSNCTDPHKREFEWPVAMPASRLEVGDAFQIINRDELNAIGPEDDRHVVTGMSNNHVHFSRGGGVCDFAIRKTTWVFKLPGADQ